MTVSAEGKDELKWWIQNIEHQSAPITIPKPSIVMKTDSSLSGWGAVVDYKPKAYGAKMTRSII